MQPELIRMMFSLAPDLAGEMVTRALVLDRIAALQPVGRRQLASVVRLPEREVRNAAAMLKDAGFITLNASGMSIT